LQISPALSGLLIFLQLAPGLDFYFQPRGYPAGRG